MATQSDNPGSSVLNSLTRLQKIDRLRELDVSSNIPLPQLVVVGNQSSGKSALLETLTGIPFPRSLERCTRYATQISQYRQDIAFIRVSIIPVGHKESSEEEAKLKGYRKELNSSYDLHHEFQGILQEVGIPS
jgi:GTPase SAR1 family protein